MPAPGPVSDRAPRCRPDQLKAKSRPAECTAPHRPDLAARCTRLGFDIGRGTISHIETGLRGMSDLEMVLLVKALRVKRDELVPGELPAWEKDLRRPTAREGDGEARPPR